MKQNDPMYIIDELAEQAGGYFAMPSQYDMAYTDLLFDICQQFGIRYYSATPKEKAFVEEVTRVTWAKEQESLTYQARYSSCLFRIITYLHNKKWVLWHQRSQNPFFLGA